MGMDQEKVIACFVEIMGELGRMNDKIRHAGGSRGVIDELKARGIYTPEWISAEFVKVENKESRESRRVREFVHDIGWAAEMRLLEGK